MRNLIFVLALLVFGFSLNTYAKGRSRVRPFVEIVSQANRGVAAIVIPGQYGIGVPVGSAFFVNAEYLVTNAHVIREAQRLGDGGFGVYVPTFVPNTNRIGGSDAVQVQIVDISDDYDVAVLKATNELRRKPVAFSLAIGSVPIGTELAVTGYGLVSDFPLTVTARAASQTSQHFRSGLSQQQASALAMSSIFVIDRPIPGGFSGAPVYLRDSGVAYGIASGSVLEPVVGAAGAQSVLGFVHPLEKLSEILDKHSIPYTKAPPVDAFVNP